MSEPLEIDLFHEVLDQRPEARHAFIQNKHSDDPARIERLERLLKAHERAEQAERAGPPSFVDAVPARIGPYRVLEVLGEGGMGRVFAAEQLEPIRRRVAIKVIKLGMATKEVIARFEAERQALAMMDHPGVARVFDAGSTNNGQPYFVMELVQGVPIHGYCDQHGLSLQDRLRLFIQVCDAVHHAHQKGIIHRDLKPSNVLVGALDAKPMPKIIDFGVMKATSVRLFEQTMFTEQGQLIGTPEYMSPEQAQMSGLDVDTRADVYSLGVVLYLLLTGALPFDSRALRSGGVAEIQRTIREVDPPLPSERLRALEQAEGGRGGAVNSRALRRELDRVVMCAIAKDRAHRYESASALREDVERYLQDQPVRAAKPSAIYRLSKLIKRHRYLAFGIALFAITALTGVAGLWVGLQNARKAEALAAQRANNAQKAAEFLQKVLFHVDPEFGGGRLSLLEVMGVASQSIEKDLGGHPEVEASVRESIGVAHRRLSMFKEAQPHLRRSLQIRRELLGDQHPQTARSFIAMADLRYEHEGSIDEALGLLERALKSVQTDTPWEGWVQLDVGIIALAGDRLSQAEAAFSRSRKLLAAQRGPTHPDISRPLRGLAMVALSRGRAKEAERLAREAVALCEGAEYICARAKLVLARVRMTSGALEEASALLEQARAKFERTVDPQHIRMAELDALASALALKAGKATEAERLAARCVAVRDVLLHPKHWGRIEAELLRQRARIALGHAQAADVALRAMAETAARRLGDDHPLNIAIARARVDIAHALQDQTVKKRRAARLSLFEAKRAARLKTP